MSSNLTPKNEIFTNRPWPVWNCQGCGGDGYIRDENDGITGLCPTCDGTGQPPAYEPTAQEFNDAMEGYA